MSLLPQYRHIINPKLKHVYLTFDEGGELIIKSPKVSLYQLEKILLKKSAWIQKSREKFQQKKGKKLDFSNAPELYFMGEGYPLILKEQSKKKSHFHFDGEQFTLLYHTYNETLFQKQIDRFYKNQVQKQLPLRVEVWAKKMNLSPANLRFRKTKRQWGSCSGNNVLSFNTMVMKLPHDVIEYIIVHELAHIRHKHHQKAFWKEVETYLPDYKLQVRELKNYTT